jgi:hypothetical protein
VTVDLLRGAYWTLKRRAAPGVDGVTWAEYSVELEQRLVDLHDRVQSERYRAKPSKRAWIPKPDGRERPLGIAALEDKIVQQALVEVLQAIYPLWQHVISGSFASNHCRRSVSPCGRVDDCNPDIVVESCKSLVASRVLETGDDEQRTEVRRRPNARPCLA